MDLDKLQNKIDLQLSKETKESLTKWLNSKRHKANVLSTEEVMKNRSNAYTFLEL